MSLDPTQHVSRRHEDEGTLEWRDAFYGPCGFFDLAPMARDHLRLKAWESLSNWSGWAPIGTAEIDARLFDLWRENGEDWVAVMAEVLA
jgi:hypothetical protein